MKHALHLLLFLFAGIRLFSQNFGLSSVQQPKCFGECNGTITFTTSAVSGPFTAVVSNGTTCPNSTVMNSNVSSITINSICACNSDYTFTLYNQNMMVVGTMVHQFPVYATSMFSVGTGSLGAASCFSCCDGYAYITYSGGNPNGNPAFTIDGVGVSAISPASTLCPGSHTVCGTDPSGCVACQVFSITAPAALEEHLTEPSFHIFPNPASGFVQIVTPSPAAISSLRIIDLSGKVMMDAENPTPGPIRLQQLSPGIYGIQLRYGSSGYSRPRKLVIAR